MTARPYDFLIVGAGLYGASFARIAADAGRIVLVIDRRPHAAGNAYTEDVGGIQVHRYGPHIFHTSDEKVWAFVRRFAEFNGFINRPVADYKGERFDLPFNMNTFRQLWGVTTPEEAAAKIEKQKGEAASTVRECRSGNRLCTAPDKSPCAAATDVSHEVTGESLEARAVRMVGSEIYEKLIKGYTEKQWGRPCSELPSDIIGRIPVRFTYNSDYYDDSFQGVPVKGYTEMVMRMLDGIELRLGTDYLDDRTGLDALACRTVYTGPLDALYGYRYGRLAYRSLRFETEDLPVTDYQGNAVVNYTDADVPWTRITEHKWFNFGRDADGRETDHSVITREYSCAYEPMQSESLTAPPAAGDTSPSFFASEGSCPQHTLQADAGASASEPFYPVRDTANTALYEEYKSLADSEPKLIIGGRLGDYRYYDMDEVIAAAMKRAAELI